MTGVWLSQGNTGQLTFKKKLGTSHTKTIENGFDMESTIIYVPYLFMRKKNSQKPLRTIFKITLKFINWQVFPDITVPIWIFRYGTWFMSVKIIHRMSRWWLLFQCLVFPFSSFSLPRLLIDFIRKIWFLSLLYYRYTGTGRAGTEYSKNFYPFVWSMRFYKRILIGWTVMVSSTDTKPRGSASQCRIRNLDPVSLTKKKL